MTIKFQKMMKKRIFLTTILCVFFFSNTIFAQIETEIADRARDAAGIADTSRNEKWVFGGRFQLSLNQMYSKNWAGSSDPFIGLSTLDNLYLFYHKDKLSWENTLDIDFGMRYTFLSTGSQKAKYEKTSDKTEFNSKLGFKAGGNWYYGALLNINSQIAVGKDPQNDSVITSGFMTPGYITLSLGMDYKRKMWSWYISPIAGKMTAKLNKDFYERPAFGVDPFKKVYFSVGAFTRISFAADIHPKINLNTKLELFYDYLGEYTQMRNLATNFEMTWRFSITDWLSVTLRTALLYDYNVRFDVYDSDGKKIEGITTDHLQFQETFGLTLGYKFKVPKK